jgi:hypothetical protein
MIDMTTSTTALLNDVDLDSVADLTDAVCPPTRPPPVPRGALT